MKKSLLTLLIASAFIACNNGKDGNADEKISPDVVTNPATANESADQEKALPVFTFEKENHEFGEIVQGEKVSFSFKFRNTGNAPLVISNASASCGCTVPEYSRSPVKPGEEGFINVTFDSAGKAGMVSKTVTIIANTVPNTKVLTISADISVPKANS